MPPVDGCRNPRSFAAEPDRGAVRELVQVMVTECLEGFENMAARRHPGEATFPRPRGIVPSVARVATLADHPQDHARS